MPVTPTAPSQRNRPCASVVPRADRAEALGLAHAVVGVEAADHARPVRVDLAREARRPAPVAPATGLPPTSIDGDARADRVARARPLVGRDRHQHLGGPERHRRRDRLHLARRIAELELGAERDFGVVAGFRSVMVGAAGAGGVEGQRAYVGGSSGVVLVLVGRVAVAAAHRALRDGAVGEHEAFELLGRLGRVGCHLRPHDDRQAAGAAAREVLHGEVDRHRARAGLAAPPAAARRPSSAERGTPRRGSSPRSNRRCWRTSCRTPRPFAAVDPARRRAPPPSRRSGSAPRSSRASPRAGSCHVLSPTPRASKASGCS